MPPTFGGWLAQRQRHRERQERRQQERNQIEELEEGRRVLTRVDALSDQVVQLQGDNERLTNDLDAARGVNQRLEFDAVTAQRRAEESVERELTAGRRVIDLEQERIANAHRLNEVKRQMINNDRQDIIIERQKIDADRQEVSDIIEKASHNAQITSALFDDKEQLSHALEETTQNYVNEKSRWIETQEDLERQLKEATEGRTNAMMWLSKTDRNLREERANINAARGEIDNITTLLDTARGEIANLTAQLDIRTGELEAKTRASNTAATEAAHAKVALNDSKAVIETAMDEIDSITTQLNIMRLERDNAREELSRANDEIDDVSNQLDVTRGERDMTRAHINDITAQLDAKMEELETVREERDNAEGQLEETAAQLIEATGELDTTARERDSARADLEVAWGDIGKLRSLLDTLQNSGSNARDGDDSSREKENGNLNLLSREEGAAASEDVEFNCDMGGFDIYDSGAEGNIHASIESNGPSSDDDEGGRGMTACDDSVKDKGSRRRSLRLSAQKDKGAGDEDNGSDGTVGAGGEDVSSQSRDRADDATEEADGDESPVPDDCSMSIASMSFRDRLRLLKRHLRDQHNKEIYLPAGEVSVISCNDNLYIAVAPGKFKDIAGTRDCGKTRLEGKELRLWVPPGKLSIARKAFKKAIEQLRVKVPKLGTTGTKAGTHAISRETLVEMIVDIMRGDAIQRILREKLCLVDGMPIVDPDDMSKQLFHLIKYQIYTPNGKKGTAICLCCRDSCRLEITNCNSEDAGCIHNDCVNAALNVTNSSAGSGIHMSTLSNPYTRMTEYLNESDLVSHSGVILLKGRLSGIFINTSIEDDLLAFGEHKSEHKSGRNAQQKERFAADDEARLHRNEKERVRQNKHRGSLVGVHSTRKAVHQPALTDEKFEECQQLSIDFLETRIKKAKRRGYGILATVADARMDSNGNVADNEHLRSVIYDGNALVRCGAKHNGVKLEAKHIGGINDKVGESGKLLQVEYLVFPCNGGWESMNLEKELTEFLIMEYPGIITNQRAGGSPFMKGDSCAVLTVLHYGRGARSGDVSLNLNAGKKRPNKTLVRLKKNMIFSEEEFILVEDGKTREHSDPSGDEITVEEEQDQGCSCGAFHSLSLPGRFWVRCDNDDCGTWHIVTGNTDCAGFAEADVMENVWHCNQCKVDEIV